MQTLLILLKLDIPEDYHKALIDYLKSANYWARPIENVWILKTTASAAAVRDGIRNRISATDQVLVLSVISADWASSNLNPKIVEWVKNNLSK